VNTNKQLSTLENKSLLITGCSSGIGRATAQYLASKGALVFASVRKAQDADALRELGLPNLIPLCPLDLTRLDQIDPVLAQVQAELRRRGRSGLDALLNNAGGGGPAPIEMLDPRELQTQLLARVAGPVALTQACLPLLRAASGRILWITTPALIPTAYVASIHACDFAVACIARTLEIELKPWNIRSIMIRCGGIQTPAGARTQSDVATLLQRDVSGRADLYRDRLQAWQQDMVDFDVHRTPPEKVASVIERALLAAAPKRQYSVGYMAGAAAFLETLPASLADAILKARY
jgi:Short-chain alcohol dehydrogenase of unknown specificity